MTKREMFAGFDMSEIERHKEKYAEEVKEKYGHIDVYKESMEKSDYIYSNLAVLMEHGPADPAVQKLVEEYRQFLTDNFYSCTLEILSGLGELYINDERFTQNIDQYRPGLARFIREAIKIYCNNHQE